MLGVLAALYILTNVSAALYAMIAVMALLPFGTFPVKIGFTPTLLDGAMGAFLMVYLFQWMTGRRQFFRLTPVHAPLLLYMGWLILSFVFGLRYAPPTSTDPAPVRRNAAEHQHGVRAGRSAARSGRVCGGWCWW